MDSVHCIPKAIVIILLVSCHQMEQKLMRAGGNYSLLSIHLTLVISVSDCFIRVSRS